MAPIKTIATIIDDEGELNNNVLNHVGIICKINTGFVIGFDPVSYNASEPDGVVTLRVRLLEGSISPGRNILVRLTTADSSAQGKLLR